MKRLNLILISCVFLSHIVMAQTQWKVYNVGNTGLPDNDVYSIVIDGSGTKWFGTLNGGLAAFNENGINSVNEQLKPVEHIFVYPNPAHE